MVDRRTTNDDHNDDSSAIAPVIASTYLATLVELKTAGHWVPAVDSDLLGGEELHVITAWNPGDERPSADDNQRADDRLRGELERRGLVPVRARGSDPASAHFEDGWAVTGLTDDEARELGAWFGQVAVFRLTSTTQTVLGCEERWSVSRSLDATG